MTKISTKESLQSPNHEPVESSQLKTLEQGKKTLQSQFIDTNLVMADTSVDIQRVIHYSSKLETIIEHPGKNSSIDEVSTYVKETENITSLLDELIENSS